MTHQDEKVNEKVQELIGVGLGPGDPELVTLKAVRVLREADLVFVPETDGSDAGSGHAETIVRAHIGAGRVARVRLPMAGPPGEPPGSRVEARVEARVAAAQAVLDAFDGGASRVAFATIGDPNVYSTFTRVSHQVRGLRPDVRVTAVPGITAMQDLAARSGTALCEGREPLTLLPITAGTDTFAAAVAGPGTVVAYKGWRWMREILDVLRCHDRTEGAVVGSDLGLPGESIVPISTVDDSGGSGDAGGSQARLPYLSAVLVPARRGGAVESGGAL